MKHIWQIVPGHPGEPGTWLAGVDDAALFISRDDAEDVVEVSGWLAGVRRHAAASARGPTSAGCLAIVAEITPRRLSGMGHLDFPDRGIGAFLARESARAV